MKNSGITAVAKTAKTKILKASTAILIFMFTTVNSVILASAAAPGGGGFGGGGGGGATADPDQTFTDLIKFFAVWFGRVGLVVGFVGAIMFALAIRNEDADAKTRGLQTMISGFVVFAVTLSLDLFGIL
jgi:hypothetical protein